MKTVGYYPGCSLHGGGREFDESLRAIAAFAGVELKEIEDWSCCGATAGHSLSYDLGVALPFRNLALAEEQGLSEVVAPCAECFSRLKGTHLRVTRQPALTERMEQVSEHRYRGTVAVLNVNQFCARLLADGLADRLTFGMGGLKVAPYYGCLLSRGDEGVLDGEDAENPRAMEDALRAAGCEAVAWNFANDCCGGGFSMSLTRAVVDLSGGILKDAREAGAEAIVTGCPMCHSNLDMRQLKIRDAAGNRYETPIVYITELLGLAAGLEPRDLGMHRHFIDALGIAARRRPAEAKTEPVPAGAEGGN